MITQLVSFGEGWTFGYDIRNQQNSFAALVAKHYGYEYQCHAHPRATLTSLYRNIEYWVENTPIEEIQQSFVLVGLPPETLSDWITVRNTKIQPEDKMLYENVVRAIDEFSQQLDFTLLQVNVLAQSREPVLPTLFNQKASMMELLVLRNRPRSNLLFTKSSFPNEEGHKNISEYLINFIDSAILNEC